MIEIISYVLEDEQHTIGSTAQYSLCLSGQPHWVLGAVHAPSSNRWYHNWFCRRRRSRSQRSVRRRLIWALILCDAASALAVCVWTACLLRCKVDVGLQSPAHAAMQSRRARTSNRWLGALCAHILKPSMQRCADCNADAKGCQRSHLHGDAGEGWLGVETVLQEYRYKPVGFACLACVALRCSALPCVRFVCSGRYELIVQARGRNSYFEV